MISWTTINAKVLVLVREVQVREGKQMKWQLQTVKILFQEEGRINF